MENGLTRIGQSDFFTVPTNGGAFTNDFVFEAVAPVPVSLALNAPSTTVGRGASIQLAAIATYSGGSTGDVTLAAKGTSYASTNPNVVTVSDAGVVTALTSGSVIVSATNDATLAMLRISVGAVSDTDGDGIPDDYELANGLNPNDPSDATRDADNDGLTNLDEYRRGTAPRTYDSDGDGVGDGLEIATNTNPLDRSSFDLSRTLQSMSVTPNPIAVFMNTLLGGGAASVKVSGVLTDGVSIDLTSRLRGTQYAIDNGGIATMGTSDGQIVGASNGNATLTVTNAGFTATAPIVVSAFVPSFVNTIPVDYAAFAATISGNFLYVAAGSSGLYIYDISNRTMPQLTGHATDVNAADVRVSGTIAYVAENGTGNLFAYDVSVPSTPTKAGTRTFATNVATLAVVGGYVYAGTAQSIEVVKAWPDFSSVASVFAGSGVRSLDIDPTGTTLAYVTSSIGAFATLDVTNPAAPIAGTLIPVTNARQVAVWGRYAYVGSEFNNCTVDVYDISNPRAPVRLGRATGMILGLLSFVDVRAGLAFFGGSMWSIGVVDVADPSAPLFRGSTSSLSYASTMIWNTAIAVDAQFVYAFNVDVETGMRSLAVGRYAQVVDTAAIPPTVQIVLPTSGTTVVEGGILGITATAADDVEVDAIDLYVGSQLFHSAKGHRADFIYNVPIGASSFTLQAKAADFGGNIGQSQVTAINVVRDVTPPNVAIVTPAAGSALLAGSFVSVSVAASDDARPPSVQLYRDGTLVGTMSAPPYTFSINVPSIGTSTTLTATAIDASGNSNSATATYAIAADQPPTVRILSPTNGDGLFAGGDVKVTVSAVDDVSVRYVEIFVDGRSVTYTYTPPYEFIVSLPVNTVSPHIVAKAADSKNQIGVSPELVLNVAPTSPLGSIVVPGATLGLSMNGTYGFVAAGKAGLQVVDAANPAAPALVSSLALTGTSVAIAVSGRYAYVARANVGIAIVDVRDPLHPTLTGSYAMAASPTSVFIDRDRLYVTSTSGLEILDISYPTSPRSVGVIATPKPARTVRVVGTTLYLLHDNEDGSVTGCSQCVRLRIVDISNEQLPQTVSASLVVKSGFGDRGAGLAIDPNRKFAHITGEYAEYSVDLSNPIAPRTVSTNDYYCCWYDASLIGSLSFSGLGQWPSVGLAWTDITRPGLPINGRVAFSFAYYATAVRPSAELIYAVGDLAGYRPIDADNPPVCRFTVGRWRTVTESNGTSPQALVTSPGDGAAFLEGQAVPIRVSALDDVAVSSVTISVDGQPVATQTVAPFDLLWDPPAGVGQHTITATVSDFGGHTTTSAAVTISVIAAPAPPPSGMTSPAPAASSSRLSERLESRQ